MKQRVHESRRCGRASLNARSCKTAADERGSAAIELVLLVPALMLLLMFAVAGGLIAYTTVSFGWWLWRRHKRRGRSPSGGQDTAPR